MAGGGMQEVNVVAMMMQKENNWERGVKYRVNNEKGFGVGAELDRKEVGDDHVQCGIKY